MITVQESHRKKPRAAAVALKEGCRVLSTTFLSLLPPLSLLLIALVSAARHQTPPPTHALQQQSHVILYTVSVFLHTRTTLVLIFLVFLVSVDALLQGLLPNNHAFLRVGRRRLYNAVIWLSSMQVCLGLWIHGVMVRADRTSNENFGVLFLLRSLLLALGLHKTVVLWRRNVVEPVVEEAVVGVQEVGYRWVEKLALAAAFGCLWWWRLRGEMEELVVVRDNVEVVDVVGWLWYCLTAVIGGARVVKGFLWVVKRIFRRRQPVNWKVNAIYYDMGFYSDVETAIRTCSD